MTHSKNEAINNTHEPTYSGFLTEEINGVGTNNVGLPRKKENPTLPPCKVQDKLLFGGLCTHDTHSEFLLHKNEGKTVFQIKYILP